MDRFSEMMVFVRVVENGSFSAAGRTLSLTPSAISKLITRLKERSGVADETTKVLIREKS
jgi:DNA-binding transcriptional LysR family regulator